ncbi:hypothetical protein OG749_45565 [Streptomyces nojiriensis]|uniref:hypothetical protein n=1 Tax=Streptomyces nojiriensis TaxID=66374 RepID=UPI002E189894
MNMPEDLGRLTEIENRAWTELIEGNEEGALQSFSEAADNLYESTLSLTAEGADPGIVLHWAIEATTALSMAAALQAEAGDARSAVNTLGRIGELAATIDLDAMSSLNAGRCPDGRITYDDNKCRRIPCR